MRSYAACIVLFLFVAPIGHADDDEDSRRSLTDLKGVEVFIGPIPPEAEQNGLTKSAIQTDVELKLRQAGITVLNAKPGQPWLSVSVSVLIRSTGQTWPYTITLELRQSAVLTRNPAILSRDAVTWSLGALGDVGRLKVSNLREDIKNMTDKFINAYLAVNPKK